MPFVVTQKATHECLRSVVVLTSPCLPSHPLSLSLSLFIAGGNKPGPFAEADLLPLAIPLCFVSKGQGSPA